VISARAWFQVVGLTVACAAVALLVGAALLRAAVRRPVMVHLLVVSCAAVATVTSAVLATTAAMVLSDHDAQVVLVVAAVSVAPAVGVGTLLGWSLRRAGRRLAHAAQHVGEAAYEPAGESTGASRAGGRPEIPTEELRTVADALDDAHRRLEQARADTAAVEQARRQLVAGMSHDLRTPLTGMRAMVESLEDGVVSDPETVGRYHHQMATEINRLSTMVDELFELSRVEGALTLDMARVAVDDLVEEAVASTEPVARSAGVRLTASAEPGLPVEVDPAELGRVLRNLLLNAVRHTPRGGEVTVTAELGPGEVRVAVTDGCGGIPTEDLARVFDTGFRGNAARTSAPGQGGGLGLAIVRGIVDAHHGSVSVANVEGGCRFEVSLPQASG
jgi:signal transduction histidine kinase